MPTTATCVIFVTNGKPLMETNIQGVMENQLIDGRIWTCTSRLRFVEREYLDRPADCLYGTVRVKQILQQLWVTSTGVQEWRDVPSVNEEK